MRQVAEIMYIVESEREAFLEGALHPDEETQKILWLCGVRKQQYYELNDLIFMTFEYKGSHFGEDMKKMASYLGSKGRLVEKRRRDVPLEERETTNWWAPVKKMATLLDTKPFAEEDEDTDSYMSVIDGCMSYAGNVGNDLSYDEEEWEDHIQIFKN